jgi:hypothetical protein
MAGRGQNTPVTEKSDRRMPWLCFACVFWCATASALSRDGNLRDLRHAAWGPKEGSPGEVLPLAQTSDGYLMVGIHHGLFRFKIVARLEMWNRAGAGTEIELKIPAADAYSKQPLHAHWRPLRRLADDER